jgi:hypothetical protein
MHLTHATGTGADGGRRLARLAATPADQLIFLSVRNKEYHDDRWTQNASPPAWG